MSCFAVRYIFSEEGGAGSCELTCCQVYAPLGRWGQVVVSCFAVRCILSEEGGAGICELFCCQVYTL